MEQEQLLQTIEQTSNMLRGMCMDPAIPPHAKAAMRVRIDELDTTVAQALEEEQ